LDLVRLEYQFSAGVVAMKIDIPENLTDEQKLAIADLLTQALALGALLAADEQINQNLWQRCLDWWYALWRRD
jgi:hypothetical protein